MIEEFKAPKSLDEAWERKDKLVGEVEEINNQLGDRNRRRDSDLETYDQWRTSAVWARTNRNQEIRYLKMWIRRENQRRAADGRQRVS